MNDATRFDDRRVVTVPLWAMTECEGDARDAMVFAQITWWLQPRQRDGAARTNRLVERNGEQWMHTTDADLAGDVGMSADQVYRARRALMKRGLIVSKAAKVGGVKQTLIRLAPTAESRNNETADSRNDSNREDADSHASARSRFLNRGEKIEKELPTTSVVLFDAPTRDPRAITTERFDEFFWSVYPARNGKKVDKGKALAQWARLVVDDQRAAVRGARHYADAAELGLQIPKDAHRWLRDRCFDDWQEPARADRPASRNAKAFAAVAARLGNGQGNVRALRP